MPIYWTLGTIPELANLSNDQRIAIWRACYGAAFRHWQTWVSMLVCALCIGTGWYVSLFWSRAIVLNGLLMWLSVVLIGSLGGGLGVLIYQQTVIAVLRPHLHTYRAHKLLQESAHPVSQ